MQTDSGDADGERDVVDESAAYTLAGTDEGWGVWDRTSRSEQPMVRYPPTDDGFELAAGYFERANRAAELRRAPWMDVLCRAALVAGGTWIVLSVLVNLWFAAADDELAARTGDAIGWLTALDNIAYSVFVVTIGAYVLFWLRGHQRP